MVLTTIAAALCFSPSPRAETVTMATGGGDTSSTDIPAILLKPDGAGPFPAIVIMHDCSGLGPRSSGSPRRWAGVLVEHGYVVIMPDSFTPRGHAGGVCTDPSPARLEVSPPRRAGDAYAALGYLRSLPFVDGSRVGLMGGSHGGYTTLAAMVSPDSGEPLTASKRSDFSAAVALYPACGVSLGEWHVTRYGRGPRTIDYAGAYRPAAPLLILIGDSDDWTPAEPCRKLAEAAQRKGYPVALKVYPGAHHAFDNNSPVRYVAARVNPNSPTGRGATTGGNAEAWADSIRELTAFFDRHLKNAER